MAAEEAFCIDHLLAVLPVDAFTGRTIVQQDFCVTVWGAGRPVRKEDGFWVFTKLPAGRIRVMLKGRYYIKKEICFKREELDLKNPFIKIKMLPDRDYPFPGETCFLEGTLSGEVSLTAVVVKSRKFRRLSLDGHKGDREIGIFQGGEDDLCGGIFYISKEDEGQGEWVETGALLDPADGRYLLLSPLQYDWDRVKTRLYEAVQTEGENDACPYFLGLPLDSEKGTKEVVCLKKEDGKTAEEIRFPAEAGARILRDF